MSRGRGRGKKHKNRKVKIEIIKFLANDNRSVADLYDHLKQEFTLKDTRGIRKHLSDLRSMKFIDGSKLLDDINTFRNIVLYLQKYQDSYDWNISEFTHNTKYGLSHINDDLVKWIMGNGIVKKWYKTFRSKQPEKRDLNRTYDFILGIPRDQLLLATRISSRVLLFLLNIDKIEFIEKKSHAYYSFRDQIFELLLQDALDHTSKLIKRYLENINIEKMTLQIEGLKLDLTYSIFPNPKLEIKNANS